MEVGVKVSTGDTSVGVTVDGGVAVSVGGARVDVGVFADVLVDVGVGSDVLVGVGVAVGKA